MILKEDGYYLAVDKLLLFSRSSLPHVLSPFFSENDFLEELTLQLIKLVNIFRQDRVMVIYWITH